MIPETSKASKLPRIYYIKKTDEYMLDIAKKYGDTMVKIDFNTLMDLKVLIDIEIERRINL